MRILAAIVLLLVGLASASADLFKAAYTNSMGAMVFGECRKIGYSVDGNAWHALASRHYDDVQLDGYDAALFTKTGKYGALAATVFATLIQIVEQNGPETFCSNVAAWAKREHPRIGTDLISRP